MHKISRTFNYFLIIIGAIVAIYAEAGAEQNQYILIGGIVVLMLGIYRVSRGIPSKFESDDDSKDNTES